MEPSQDAVGWDGTLGGQINRRRVDGRSDPGRRKYQ